MASIIKRGVRRVRRLFKRGPRWASIEGPEGVRTHGHRLYVGGHWDEMGALQRRFMISQGLRPQNVLVDIACGSLRAGIHFIPYLDRGNYLGIEKEPDLVEAGIEKELGRNLYEEKAPEFVISDAFEFARFTKAPDYAIAQSLFTHLTAEDIQLCLRNLRAFVQPGCRLYATFLESPHIRENPDASHAHKGFYYTQEEMATFGEQHGWRSRYVGEWGHPFGQMMMEYVAV